MRFAPVLKAILLAALGFSIAGALLTRGGVGVVEWLVGVGIVAVLGACAAHFARQSFRAT